MGEISVSHFTFTYPNSPDPVLRDISFSVREGSICLICGDTGSGKTTLLRNLKAEIKPHGTCSGDCTLPESSEIGYVFQNPDTQIVTDLVWRELAFGLENMGFDSGTIQRRIGETAHYFGIEPWIDRQTHQLSGGQKQLLNLAAVIAMQPKLLILDEPTAQLDPIAAKEFLSLVRRINAELGITVLLSEHQLEDVLPAVRQVIQLERGACTYDGSPEKYAAWAIAGKHTFRDALPAAVRISYALGERKAYPMTVNAGRAWLENRKAGRHAVKVSQPEVSGGEACLLLRNVWYRYAREDSFVLRGADLSVTKGEILSIVGGNGSGKSTLLFLLSGARKPQRGGLKRSMGLRTSLLTQDPKALFTGETLLEELREWQTAYGYKQDDIETVTAELGLGKLMDRHPYDLSGGEMQKAALAKLLLISPDILLLDEPTKGLDIRTKMEVRNIMMEQKKRGKTIVLATHDIEFAAAVSDRCAMMFHGRIACREPARAFFLHNLFYTTPARRMTQGLLEEIILPEEVEHA